MNGRKIVGGQAFGKAVVSKQSMLFFGGIDPRTGIVIEHNHELRSKHSGKGVCIPTGQGQHCWIVCNLRVAKVRRGSNRYGKR